MSKDKEKKAKKPKAAADPNAITLGTHPRATRSVRRARALGGLLGFVATIVLSLQADVPAWDAAVRALSAGIALHLVAWAVAVTVWRQLMLAEMRAAHDRRLARAQRRADLARGDGAATA